MKKILFYESRPDWGGAQKCELDLILGLENYGFQTYFLTSTTGSLVDRAAAAGKEIITIPVTKSVDNIRKDQVRGGISFLLKQFFEMIPHLWNVFFFLMKNKIEIVYTSQMRSQIIVGWLARLAGKKVVWHIHGQENLDNLLGKLCVYSANRIIVVSHKIADEYVKLYPRMDTKFVRIHNGLDLMIECRGAGQSDVITLVMVGRLLAPKRQDILIHAVKRLKERGYNVRAIIVGDKPPWHNDDYVDSLNRLAEELGVANAVEFCGWVEQPQNILQRSDIFVLPSDTEGLPLSIIEAMAAGLPCIGTNVGGVSELIVDGETGYVVEPDNIDALTAALEKLLINPKLLEKMGQNSRERYERNFTKKAFLEGVAGVIHTVK